jgi:hypothetical protein
VPAVLVAVAAMQIILASPAMAQEAERVSGRLVESGDPVAGVTVAVAVADGTPVGAAVSDEDGRWTVDLPGPGSYLISGAGEAGTGIEPVIGDLQSPALPLGHPAVEGGSSVAVTRARPRTVTVGAHAPRGSGTRSVHHDRSTKRDASAPAASR